MKYLLATVPIYSIVSIAYMASIVSIVSIATIASITFSGSDCKAHPVVRVRVRRTVVRVRINETAVRIRIVVRMADTAPERLPPI